MMDVVEDNTISPGDSDYLAKLKLHCLPMTSPMFHLGKVTEIYRFEHFQTEYRKLADKLGCACSEIPHCRQSQRKPYQSYFTAADRRRCLGQAAIEHATGETRGLALRASCQVRLASDLEEGVYRWRVQALDANGVAHGEPSDWAFFFVARR